MKANREQLVARLKDGSKCKIGFLIGAGASCAAGIPDFRSPTGLYATLKAEKLTCTPDQLKVLKRDPSMVVSWSLFCVNQFPYHEVRKPFILGLHEGKWKSTLSHFFMKICQDKELLTQVWTQNIDGLDLKAGVTPVVEVHGTILKASCEFCGGEFPFDEYAALVRSNIKNIYDTIDDFSPTESQNILCKSCNKAGVKPATVLFGRSLPSEFYEAQRRFAPVIDVLFVVGTSLNVSPANLLPTEVRSDCLRVICNREMVGEDLGLGQTGRDVFLQGDCDEVLLELAVELGWLHDLAKYKDEMCPASKQLVEKAQKHTK